MNESELSDKRARMTELDNLLDGRTKHAPNVEQKLLHEALFLCEELELDGKWRRFKARLERIQREEVEKKASEKKLGLRGGTRIFPRLNCTSGLSSRGGSPIQGRLGSMPRRGQRVKKWLGWMGSDEIETE